MGCPGAAELIALVQQRSRKQPKGDHVAVIRSFSEKKPERETRHSEVEATWHVAEQGGSKFLQIDTYGSSERMLAGKVSQSIRLDAHSAAQLRNLIDRVFP